MNIQISSNFKKMATRAVLSIFLFIFIYLLLISLAAGITVLFVVAAFYIIVAKPMIITLGLGTGLASLGLIILIFLFKFLFRSNKNIGNNYVEIFEKDEPKLFALIREVVDEVQTKFPNKVLISSEVNASVFYNSNFWSMLFPVRKNLLIGLGLVNSVNQQEFKAILAHEFGHFSQKSMKVGSYVYNLNKIIYSMFNNNESFEKMIASWSNINGYFAFFAGLANMIIKGIQWIMIQVYEIVNISYLSLSREMEFHADEIAANVAGYLPLKESLLRLNLSEYSYNTVLNFYESKIPQGLKSENIFKEHSFVMNFIALECKYSFKGEFPHVSETDVDKFNKSRITIKNQWESHPSLKERIKALESTNIIKSGSNAPANTYFKNIDEIQTRITEDLFAKVVYEHTTTSNTFEQFKKEFTDNYHKNTFPKEYNEYYDNKNPLISDLESISDFDNSESLENLFSGSKVELILNHISLENDKHILNEIKAGNIKIKSFDFDGKKYKSKKVDVVLKIIDDELKNISILIALNDKEIYKFFYHIGMKSDNHLNLKKMYANFFKLDESFTLNTELYNSIHKSLDFINVQTPFALISEKFESFKPLENKLKDKILDITNKENLQSEITPLMRNSFDSFLLKELRYFEDDKYNDINLEILFSALNNFYYLMQREYFIVKKELLEFQINLLKS